MNTTFTYNSCVVSRGNTSYTIAEFYIKANQIYDDYCDNKEELLQKSISSNCDNNPSKKCSVVNI